MFRMLTVVGLAVGLVCFGQTPESSRAVEPDVKKPLSRIAFGSCAKEDKPQPIWEPILATKPDLFLFLGDNIYGDTEDMDTLKAKYAKLAADEGYRKLKKQCPILATWDDHDYGVNDGGTEYPKKKESQAIMLDFFDEPADSPRRKQEGVYDAKVFGPEGKRVQIILIDTRYHRSPLFKRAGETPKGEGPYDANNDPKSTMLGDSQWKWLAEQLEIPAEVRIICSSIQFVAEEHRWERWANFPHERLRMLNLLKETKAAGVIFISGDRHYAELSMLDAGLGYPLYDVTSSALNQSSKNWRKVERNGHRLGAMPFGDNFGLIAIDWKEEDPKISLQLRDIEGDVQVRHKIKLSHLKPGTIK